MSKYCSPWTLNKINFNMTRKTKEQDHRWGKRRRKKKRGKKKQALSYRYPIKW